MLPPGSTIGILGGGQLGRMTAMAAAQLGYRVEVLAPEADPPTAQVANRHHRAAYEDEAALASFAEAVDVVTYEFENVPLVAAETLAKTVPVRPGPHVLATCQDRLDEKTFVRRVGGATAPFAAVDSADDLRRAVREIGLPAVLKTRRLGYDGKGQIMLAKDWSPDQAEESVAAIGSAPAILEGFVDFSLEMSVIVARGPDGAVAVYDVIENAHENHILAVSKAPAAIPAEARDAALDLAGRLATAFDLVGLLAVEMFLAADGSVLVNEMAPRPHNSGHWTIEGAATSQFEQLVRAVCGLPLGSTACLGRAEMHNLIGDQADRWPDILREPGTHLHLYGKGESRPGRKMGHVTRVR